jgi:SagB-type dehydrogenase family enzyme
VLRARAAAYRELSRHAPLIVATLDRLGDAPTLARAVARARLGRCLHVGGRADLAIAPLCEALRIAGDLGDRDAAGGLVGALHAEIGLVEGALGRAPEATSAYESALDVAASRGDLLGQLVSHEQLAAIAEATGGVAQAAAHLRAALALVRQLGDGAAEAALVRRLGEADARSAGSGGGDETPEHARIDVAVFDDVATDVVFETDLLVDAYREQRITRAEPASAPPLGLAVRPAVVPLARCWADDDTTVSFALGAGEPRFERDAGCVVVRRRSRRVTIAGAAPTVWRLVRAMDGERTVAAILAGVPAADRPRAAELLAALAAAGVVDQSGRAVGHFLHTATKKGVLPAGGLTADAVLRLAGDGGYRAYPDAPRTALDAAVPAGLRAFHELTRARRSYRDYQGTALPRAELDALLLTACGVTGALASAARALELRAYPSSGALYAVEVYPVVLRVDGLASGVYHYAAGEHALELVRGPVDPARLVAATLPAERAMVAGAAVLLCLVGVFPRHERKYGEGGYRMLVAEAGHISQNLVLAATALGLAARPFGGVFDDLVNADLGLDAADEQFLLGVLVGRAGPGQGA